MLLYISKSRVGFVISIIFAILLSCLSFTDCNVLAKPTKGKFFVVGVGPAGPKHATLKAINCIKQADFILCSKSLQKRFSEYLNTKTIICDHPWRDMFEYKGKPWRKIVESDPKLLRKFEEHRIQVRNRTVKQIKEKIEQGLDVALLSSGDPCLFGPAHWYAEGFEPENVEIIPGVGAFSAAMAALEKSSIPAYQSRFVLQTAPSFLLDQNQIRSKDKGDRILKDISKYQGTYAFYMALPKIDNLIERLQANYSSDMPMAIVYYAGYPEKEKIVKGTLNTIREKIQNIDENWLGMVIMGSCLQGGEPYRSPVEDITRDKQ